MTDILLWIAERWPALGICLLLVVAAIFVTAKVVKWKGSVESKTACLPDSFKKLPCEDHMKAIDAHNNDMKEIKGSLNRLDSRIDSLDSRIGTLDSRIDTLDSRIDSLDGRIDSMGDNLSDISRWIMKLDPSTIDTLAMKHSPRRMTAAGLQLYEISGAKNALENNVEYFLEELQKINPSTPFDVEDKAFDVLMKNLSMPLFNPIKNYIYYQPDKVTLKTESGEDVTVTLSLMAIVKLMSLELRDRYLAAHPEIEDEAV